MRSLSPLLLSLTLVSPAALAESPLITGNCVLDQAATQKAAHDQMESWRKSGSADLGDFISLAFSQEIFKDTKAKVSLELDRNTYQITKAQIAYDGPDSHEMSSSPALRKVGEKLVSLYGYTYTGIPAKDFKKAYDSVAEDVRKAQIHSAHQSLDLLQLSNDEKKSNIGLVNDPNILAANPGKTKDFMFGRTPYGMVEISKNDQDATILQGAQFEITGGPSARFKCEFSEDLASLPIHTIHVGESAKSEETDTGAEAPAGHAADQPAY
jgi:hypothetical protein